MTDRFETFLEIVEPLLLCNYPFKVSILYSNPSGFYVSPNDQNRVCELCMFPKSGHKYVCMCYVSISGVYIY